MHRRHSFKASLACKTFSQVPLRSQREQLLYHRMQTHIESYLIDCIHLEKDNVFNICSFSVLEENTIILAFSSLKAYLGTANGMYSRNVICILG